VNLLEENINQLPQDALVRVLDLTQKLAAPFDVRVMLHEVLEVGKELLEADTGSVWLYSDQKEMLEMYLPEIDPRPCLEPDKGIVGECFSNCRIVNVPDCYADERFDSATDRNTGYKTRCLLSIPLLGFDDSRVGVLQVLNKKGGIFTDRDELLASALAAKCAVALQRAQMMETMMETERFYEEVMLAKLMQQATMPTEMPRANGYDFFGFSRPAEFTGGDLYDLVEISEKIFLLVGDATGHGFGPALSATQMQAMLRVAFRVGADLKQACVEVNNQLVEDLPDDRFLTAFIGFLDQDNHKIEYYSAGQGPLLHYHAANDSVSWYGPTSFPIGVMELSTVESEQVELQPGDILGVLSDGVYEFENEAGEQFGESRVAELVKKHQHRPMSELNSCFMAAIESFAGEAEQQDDITVVLVKRNAEA